MIKIFINLSSYLKPCLPIEEKTKNKIKQLFDERIIEENNLDQYFDLRAENISKENFYQLTKLLKD